LNPSKLLFLFAFWAAMLSCKSKEHGDTLINTGLGEIHLPNQEAENDFNKGLFYIRQENYSAAKHFFLMADEESPNTPVILNAIGNSMERVGDTLQGLTYFKKAMRIDSNFLKTYVNYGCALNNCRRYDEAEEIFRIGLSKRSLPPFDRTLLYLNLANSYYYRDQNDNAIALLDSAKMGLTNRSFYNEIDQFENRIKQEAHWPRDTSRPVSTK
jgi:tetratricopeptide (TPR) repeat protein